ncbi:hypothetical protein IAT40_004477 [Kwoniella sp. CBS 6097]
MSLPQWEPRTASTNSEIAVESPSTNIPDFQGDSEGNQLSDIFMRQVEATAETKSKYSRIVDIVNAVVGKVTSANAQQITDSDCKQTFFSKDEAADLHRILAEYPFNVEENTGYIMSLLPSSSLPIPIPSRPATPASDYCGTMDPVSEKATTRPGCAADPVTRTSGSAESGSGFSLASAAGTATNAIGRTFKSITRTLWWEDERGPTLPV